MESHCKVLPKHFTLIVIFLTSDKNTELWTSSQGSDEALAWFIWTTGILIIIKKLPAYPKHP